MKNDSVLNTQTYMCMSPPHSLEEMRRAAERCKEKDFYLKQTLNYCMSGRVDLKKPDTIDVEKELLQRLNGRPAWRYAERRDEQKHGSPSSLLDQDPSQYRPALPPSWLKHDRQTLRFYAYFQEPVRSSPLENYRVRYCIILYYLEDGTMQILEPRIENGGIPQGAFLRRHKFPRADGSGFLTIEDLKLNTDLTIYNRVFRVVDCDEFTRWLLLQCNIDAGVPEKPLGDNFFENEVTRRGQFLLKRRLVPTDVKASREYTEIILGGSRKNVGLKQYLDNDRKVLRFFCYWDDKTAYGVRNYYVLHYFLADDAIEIMECYFPNQGKRNFPTFLKRQRLPKCPSAVSCPGVEQPTINYYKPEDLTTGANVQVYGRSFYLYDCDDFTREFYKKYMGIVQVAEVIANDVQEPIKMHWPPHDLRIGSEEDTMASCLHIVPKRPLKNEREYLFGEEVALVFLASLLHERREDEGRVFIITIRERDDNISVFELRGKSAGHAGGKFAEAGKKTDPCTKRPYAASDFFIGATVNIHGLPFVVIDADDRTLKHMEQNPQKYPVADLQLIRSKISGIVEALRASGVDSLAANDLQYHFRGALVPHEMVTLRRHIFHSEANQQEADVAKSVSGCPHLRAERERTLTPYNDRVDGYASPSSVALAALME